MGGREGAGLKPTCELSFPTFACKIPAAGFQQRAAVICSPVIIFHIINRLVSAGNKFHFVSADVVFICLLCHSSF